MSLNCCQVWKRPSEIIYFRNLYHVVSYTVIVPILVPVAVIVSIIIISIICSFGIIVAVLWTKKAKGELTYTE